MGLWRGEFFWLRQLHPARSVCVSPSAFFIMYRSGYQTHDTQLTALHVDILFLWCRIHATMHFIVRIKANNKNF